jgi:serine/threonine protein kinase
LEELQAGDPERIGPYTLTARLGAGGMGLVFLGQSAGGRLVAVKVIHPQLAMDKGFRARFDREIAAARRVGGFYTAPVVDADTTGQQPWLATGYVDGPSLEEAVTGNGPMPEESLLILAAGLAEGLGAIHSVGVVHRDLKPSNVMLAPDGVRVIDFGIAQAAGETMLTGTGLVIGSPWFMSPEQVDGREIGPASDVFSLGGVLVYAATGEGPFGSGGPAQQLYRVVHGNPCLDGLPDRLRPLVMDCMAKDPAQRPTAAQFIALLPQVPRNPWLRPSDWWPAATQPESKPTGRPPQQDPPADAVPAAAILTETIPSRKERPAQDGPSGPTDAQTRPSGLRLARKRWRWAIPGAAVAVAAAVTGGLLAAAPGHHSPPPPLPVLQPAGLAAAAASYTSISVHWSGPRTGPVPDKYEILQDGSVAGSVPGNSTFYQATGLSPATAYHFRVIAIRGGVRSLVSSAITSSTGTPPLPDAVFEWHGTTQTKFMTAKPDSPDPSWGKLGQSWSNDWNFTSDCTTGQCGTVIAGFIFGDVDFTMHLSRDSTGTVYTGTKKGSFTDCSGKADTGDTLRVQITVTRGSPTGTVWAVDQWTGKVTLVSPATASCSGETFTLAAHSA